MVKHIVFWRIRGREDERTREEQARAIKAKIESLQGKIPGLLHIEAGVDIVRSEFSYDVVLYSELESRAALDAYQVHPLHKEVAAFVNERRTERANVDYEV
jgi:hypothetical protein